MAANLTEDTLELLWQLDQARDACQEIIDELHDNGLCETRVDERRLVVEYLEMEGHVNLAARVERGDHVPPNRNHD